ncbi:unnamed protein product [Closterium sp. Naga37s-1]|nr:unnamed protein product [Closterium sp. Naga37s-1]
MLVLCTVRCSMSHQLLHCTAPPVTPGRTGRDVGGMGVGRAGGGEEGRGGGVLDLQRVKRGAGDLHAYGLVCIGPDSVFVGMCHSLMETPRQEEQVRPAKMVAEAASNVKSMARMSHETRTLTNVTFCLATCIKQATVTRYVSGAERAFSRTAASTRTCHTSSDLLSTPHPSPFASSLFPPHSSTFPLFPPSPSPPFS